MSSWYKTLPKKQDERPKNANIAMLSGNIYPKQRPKQTRNVEPGTRVPMMGYEDTVRTSRMFRVEGSPVFIESIQEKVVMTDNTETIRIYESNGKRCENIHAENPRSMLCGLAVNGTSNSLFVCDAIGGGESRVQIFNIADDNEITPVVYLGQGLFQAPHGICVTKDHKILVTDVEKKEVYIIQEDGYNAVCFGERGKRRGQFIYPHDVVYDEAHKRIIVSDSHNHRLQVFSSAGEFIDNIEFDENGKRLFIYPTGLKIDPIGNLIVCQNGCDFLTILDEDLRPYHHLDTTSLGLSKPTSIAVLPYERLCVSSSEMSSFVIF